MIRRALIVACLPLFAACAGSPPAPVQLYQLGAIAPAGNAPALNTSLGFGPVLWPEYLRRRQIVIRLNAYSIDTAENNHWGEPLRCNFGRTLRENISHLLKPTRLQSYPWNLADAPRIQIPLEVLQFDTSAQGETVLRARWRIITHDKKELAAERVSELRLQGTDRSMSAAVQAQSEALARLSAEISTALRGVPLTSP